ncbi:MAG: radical SAM protein [Anaerolineae bacterium]|nr:radical SAM protein [Anaerolineae bacterium]
MGRSLSADLEEALDQAWQARLRHWPPLITASVPVDTLAVSVTGTYCALNCAHCGGHYLSGMRPLNGLRPGAAPSLLISGGCDRRGRVPVRERLPELLPLVQGRRTNWHLGLVHEEDLEGLDGLLDVVSFDFVGDDDTLREVYGLEATADDLERCLDLLASRARVVPHITVGLRAGRLGHEWLALERLEGHRFDALVFLVLIPTPGTPYASVQPPEPEEVAEVLAAARLRFPRVSLQLGCMRPKGSYRDELDPLAVRAGLNVIVNPVRAAIALAEAMGLSWLTGHECCVFPPASPI